MSGAILNHPTTILLLASVAILTAIWIFQRIRPDAFEAIVRRGDSWACRIGSQRIAVIVGAAVSVCTLRVLFLWAWPIPQPSVPDEFSYLLMGDTFASGRVANPPHPMWRHFETLFVLQQPTYASIYPPAQGLFLALGKWATGTPWWGVWFSAGLMCAAVAWAIQGWLPPRWSILGIIWVCALTLTTYWMNSYWGGAVTAGAGAIMAGAIARMRVRITWQLSLAFATGAAVLANSRPYEGLWLTAVLTIWLFTQARRQKLSHQRIRSALVVPVTATLVLPAIATGLYFYRVTGSVWKHPQEAYYEQYAASPAFIWQRSPPEPHYNDDSLRANFITLRRDYERFQTFRGAMEFTLYKLRLLGSFYLGPLVFLPLLAFRPIFRGRLRIIALGTLITLSGILLTVPIQYHYAASLTALFAILGVQSLRCIWISQRRGWSVGKLLVPAVPIVCLVQIAVAASAAQPPTALRARSAVVSELARRGGPHLVIVHYSPQHNVGEEWVYNAADIDHSAIVWARDLGSDRNQELFRYFPNRKRWLLGADSRPLHLVPYEDPKEGVTK